MLNSSLVSLHRLVWTALLAALIAAGAFLIIPIGPVPVSMQPLFILLAGYVLGPIQGVACMGLYLVAGACGLPVFSGGGSGLGHLFGPTAGYLFGFLGTVFFAGQATGGEGRSLTWLRGVSFGLLGLAVVYAMGVAGLMASLDMTLAKALAVGCYPFILWDICKIFLAVACYRLLVRYSILFR